MANRLTDSTYQPQAYWYWQSNCSVGSSDENDGWTKFSDIESEIIEEAFYGENNTHLVELDHYWINLNDSMQISKNDATEQRQIKRVVMDRNADRSADRSAVESFLQNSKCKPFNDSGLEGGIAFIYDWKKRNAALSHSEIVRQAANGILLEGNQIGKHREAQYLAEVLLAKENKSENDILAVCISLYTRECFLYRLVNTALRENDKTKVDTLAPFCYFLTEAIWSNALADERFKAVVYRGVCLDPDSIRQYQEAVGTYKCWYGFISTSRNRNLADFYDRGSLFIIDISCSGGLDVSRYSHFPDEEEIVLPPGTTFRIDKVEQSDDKTYIYIYVILEVRMVLLGRTGTGK